MVHSPLTRFAKRLMAKTAITLDDMRKLVYARGDGAEPPVSLTDAARPAGKQPVAILRRG